MRKWLYIILIGIIFLIPNAQTAFADSRSEIVMEVNSKQILHHQNADAILPMASTTKIMTAWIICEQCNLDDVIHIPHDAVGIEGSSIYLRENEEISIIDLLYGLMLRSGNDSAVALALYHSGSIINFVDVMNKKASQLGLRNTHFCNPHGLPDKNHYTTAKELATIACHAMQNPIFHQIVGTQQYKGKYRSYQNKNKILRTVEGGNGIKTGYTKQAGRCLVSSAKRNGIEVVCVVLNCPEMFERSALLLNHAIEENIILTIKEGTFIFSRGKCYCIDKPIYLVVPRDDSISLEIVNESSELKLQIKLKNKLLFEGILGTI